MLMAGGNVDVSEERVDDAEVDGMIVTELFLFWIQEDGRTRWPSTSMENTPKNMLMPIVTFVK